VSAVSPPDDDGTASIDDDGVNAAMTRGQGRRDAVRGSVRHAGTSAGHTGETVANTVGAVVATKPASESVEPSTG
jgi:hypothetical protein